MKLIRQVDIVDSERVSWFEGLTSEFAGVFEGVLQKKSASVEMTVFKVGG